MNTKFLFLALVLVPVIAVASSARDLSRFVGWTIAAKKTIVGYVDDKGNEKSQFDGCNFNWRVIFDDRTYLTCTGYSYHYAYRPDAILLVRNNSWIMIVDDEAFEMNN